MRRPRPGASWRSCEDSSADDARPNSASTRSRAAARAAPPGPRRRGPGGGGGGAGGSSPGGPSSARVRPGGAAVARAAEWAGSRSGGRGPWPGTGHARLVEGVHRLRNSVNNPRPSLRSREARRRGIPGGMVRRSNEAGPQDRPRSIGDISKAMSTRPFLQGRRWSGARLLGQREGRLHQRRLRGLSPRPAAASLTAPWPRCCRSHLAARPDSVLEQLVQSLFVPGPLSATTKLTHVHLADELLHVPRIRKVRQILDGEQLGVQLLARSGSSFSISATAALLRLRVVRSTSTARPGR